MLAEPNLAVHAVAEHAVRELVVVLERALQNDEGPGVQDEQRAGTRVDRVHRRRLSEHWIHEINGAKEAQQAGRSLRNSKRLIASRLEKCRCGRRFHVIAAIFAEKIISTCTCRKMTIINISI